MTKHCAEVAVCAKCEFTVTGGNPVILGVRLLYAMHILLGPLLMAMDVAPENVCTGVVLTIILLPAMALVAFRPRAWTAAVSFVAFLAWMFLGVIGAGIGC